MQSSLFAMSAISAPVIAAFAVTLYVGLHHLATWLWVREDRANLALGLTCLAMACYDACEVAVFNAPSGASVLPWHRVQIASIALVGMGLLWAIGARTHRDRPWHLLLHAGFVTSALFFLLDRSHLAFEGACTGTKVIHYPLLGSHLIHEARPGPALYFLTAVGVTAYAVMFGMAWAHRRATHRDQGTVLLIGLTVLFGTMLSDVFTLSNLYTAPYLMEFGYLAIVVIMSLSMTRQVSSGVEATRALYDARYLLNALVDNSEAAIFVKDVESKYLLVNRHFEQTFGVQRDDVVGKTDYQVFPQPVARSYRSRDRTVLLQGKPTQTEETTGDPPDERIWLVTRFPIRDEAGEPRALGGIATDITERARAEAEVRRYRDHLEERVSERTRDLRRVRDDLLQANEDLETARAAAEAAAEAKGRFLATMSHEIRTPMNAMMALVSLVLESDLTDEQRGNLETALHGSQGLLRIINDILDYSKMEADHLTIELRPFHLPNLLRELGDMYRALAEAKALAFHLDLEEGLPTAVLGDEDRLRQVLSNLLSNALKFSHEGSMGLCAAVDREGDLPRIRFEVTDTGIGVPLHQQQAIFGEFLQADQSVTRRYGGTGLGLAISQRIAKQLGGHITLQSTPGEGSTFTLLLPLPESHEDFLPPESAQRAQGPTPAAPASALPAPPENDRPHVSSRSAGSPRVLIVEDNPLNQKVARALLRKLGCIADVCDNGQEALAILRPDDPEASPSEASPSEASPIEASPPEASPSEASPPEAPPPYDLVLMDWEMPVMDGITATRAIRERLPSGHTLPIVGLTANADRHAHATCIEAGMQDCLVKPITIGRLRALLATILDYDQETQQGKAHP